MRWGVIVFPGSLDDRDALRATERVLGDEAVPLWHKDRDLHGVDCVVLPGGFSYGDYLRCGAMAKVSPIMEEVRAHAQAGGLVLGICNGFQILCEAGLLPAALVRERRVVFRYTDRGGRVVPEANPNGALANVAGVCSAGRNVLGLMPHPEHAVERLTGGEDGLRILRSVQLWCGQHGVGERRAPTVVSG